MARIVFKVLFLLVFASFAVAVEREDAVFYKGTPGLPGNGKNAVLISGDEEYRNEESLVQLGRILATRHGFDCHVLFAINRDTGEIDPETLDNIPGLETLDKADVMVLALRFRNLPDEQMKHIDDYLMSGRPVIGLRTSTHAFRIPKDRIYARYSFDFDDKGGPWQQGFGRLVLGETWIDHHGHHGVEATRGVVAPGQESNPLLRACDGIFGPTDVYAVRLPLPVGCVPILYGEVLEGMKPDDKVLAGKKNDPKMPAAWTKSYRLPGGKEGRCFTTTMGSARDFSSEGLRRLVVNAVYAFTAPEDQAAERVPERADVAIVGTYEPSAMGFAKHRKGLKPRDVR